MYFIAETKWDKEAEGLNDDERIKIKCAKNTLKQSIKALMRSLSMRG